MTYSAATEKAMAAELAHLPPGSTLAAAMVDYGQLRAADRACMGVKR